MPKVLALLKQITTSNDRCINDLEASPKASEGFQIPDSPSTLRDEKQITTSVKVAMKKLYEECLEKDQLMTKMSGELDAARAELHVKTNMLDQAFQARGKMSMDFSEKCKELEDISVMLASRENELSTKNLEVLTKKTELAAKDARLDSKNAQLDYMEAAGVAKDALVKALEAQLKEKVADLEVMYAMLKEKEAVLARKDELLTVANAKLAATVAELAVLKMTPRTGVKDDVANKLEEKRTKKVEKVNEGDSHGVKDTEDVGKLSAGEDNENVENAVTVTLA